MPQRQFLIIVSNLIADIQSGDVWLPLIGWKAYVQIRDVVVYKAGCFFCAAGLLSVDGGLK